LIVESAAETPRRAQPGLQLALRWLIVVAVAIGYGWAAPELLGPRRYEHSTWATFLALHAITFAGAIAIALHRRPRFGNLLLASVVVLTWAYLFFFVWFNTFGT
jgi:hypothetical protein